MMYWTFGDGAVTIMVAAGVCEQVSEGEKMDDVLTRVLFEAEHCRTVVEGQGGLLLALLAAGALGSLNHCLGMCGPFVLAQVTAQLEQIPLCRLRERQRWLGALLVPYHLGRITTYAGLGALAAALTAGVQSLPGLRWFGAALLATAAAGFMVSAAGQLRGTPLTLELPWSNTWSSLADRMIRPLLATVDPPRGWHGYRLGLALGFIPCGLIYGALAAAAASADPLAGAMGMAVFALGTVPALVVVGLAGHLAGRCWHPLVTKLTPALMITNAAGLAWLAWRLAQA